MISEPVTIDIAQPLDFNTPLPPSKYAFKAIIRFIETHCRIWYYALASYLERQDPQEKAGWTDLSYIV